MIQSETPVTRAPFGPQFVLVCIRQVQPSPVIDWRLAHIQLLLALQIQFGRCFEHLVKMPRGAKLISGLGVAVQPQRLPLDPIPMHAQPFQIAHDTVDIFLLRAFLIGIVQPQDERAARFPGDQIVEQRGAQIADMDVAGR